MNLTAGRWHTLSQTADLAGTTPAEISPYDHRIAVLPPPLGMRLRRRRRCATRLGGPPWSPRGIVAPVISSAGWGDRFPGELQEGTQPPRRSLSLDWKPSRISSQGVVSTSPASSATTRAATSWRHAASTSASGSGSKLFKSTPAISARSCSANVSASCSTVSMRSHSRNATPRELGGRACAFLGSEVP
jgi:hypothetical protein